MRSNPGGRGGGNGAVLLDLKLRTNSLGEQRGDNIDFGVMGGEVGSGGGWADNFHLGQILLNLVGGA